MMYLVWNSLNFLYYFLYSVEEFIFISSDAAGKIGKNILKIPININVKKIFFLINLNQTSDLFVFILSEND